MNTITKLAKACEAFAKLALLQTKIDPSKKKEIDLWSNTLFAGVRGTASYVRSPSAAKAIFDNIAAYRSAPAYGDPAVLKEVESLLTALEYAEDKLKPLGLDPVEVLRQKGMQNLNVNTINVLKRNLQILSDGKDFSKYQHYYLVAPGTAHPKDVIELDEKAPAAVARNDSGY